MATTTYLTSNFGSGTDDGVGQKSTHSVWIKRTNPDDRSTIISGMNTNSSNYMKVRFGDNDRLQIYGVHSGSVNCNVETKAGFRDVSGWYHIVLQIDTTNSTASERIKWYVNGELQELNTATYPSAGEPNYLVISDDLEIGRNTVNDNEHFDGTMSYFNATYGTVYAASEFGETDATTGEWKIKANITGVNYGTYGFFILKDGNSVTDQSGKGNNFTVAGGTLTKTEDCPSNVFATMNSLSKGGDAVLSKGNTILRNDQSTNANVLGTIALGNGKYYWETYKHGGGSTGLGVTLARVDGSNHSEIHSYRVNYFADGNIYQNGFGLSDINTGVTYADTDIIGVSVDTENGTIKFYKNGALVNNSSQTNSAFTYAQNELIPFWYVNNGGEWRTNFGNGYFGTTAITSAGTNASGNGIFEYDVQPTDATALSTKGLNL